MSKRAKVEQRRVRCAIYTRKSSDEGLQQEYTSLDAQRDAAEAYIASQKAEGWVVLPEHYDDGGFTGGNIERPALRRLLMDIEAGKVDAVVVYKFDRLSRSLLDFTSLMAKFDKHGVAFVSITQQINTQTSVGRLMQNMLMSFAQFEREMISERIRDKIAASRQRGQWTGGRPVLGYDVDRSSRTPKLVVNAAEAAQVRWIFEAYLEHGSLLAVVRELDAKGWRTKALATRDGKQRGGQPFDKTRLHMLLTNVLYTGKMRHKDRVHAGQHEAIIPDDLFKKVQAQLAQNGRHAGGDHRNRHGALLRGLLYCKGCGRAMTHTFTNKGRKRYRYYTCTSVIKSGRSRCGTPSLPSAEIERAVVDQIRCIGLDPSLLGETFAATQAQCADSLKRLTDERALHARALARCHAELRRVVCDAFEEPTRRIAELNDEIARSERRLAEIEAAEDEARRDAITEAEVTEALADFENLWAALNPREQARVISLLVKRVVYDPADQCIEVTFHPAGIRALAEEADIDEPAARQAPAKIAGKKEAAA